MLRNALVLYGSETGNAQDVAEETGRLLQRFRFDTTVLDLDSIQLRDVVKYTAVIFVISTTGQGEFPQNSRLFWSALLSGALRPGILRKLKFTSFGLGDSSYAQFNVAHRMLHSRLIQLGAQSFCERGEGNEQHPEGHSSGLREWTVGLLSSLTQVFPLSDGLSPIADDVFIEPQWKLNFIPEEESIGSRNGVKDASGDVVPPPPPTTTTTTTTTLTTTAATATATESPSSDLLPVANAHTANILGNSRLTPTTHFQDVRLLEMEIPKMMDYGPGAVSVIYPKNFPDDVQSFVDLMGWNDMADIPLRLISDGAQLGSSPSPLRHLDLTKTAVTIRWLLENAIDFMSIPRRSFFASLVHFASDSNDDEAYQKERLLELANPELIDELWDYTTRPKRTILEVMMDFTTIKIPWKYAVHVLPITRGRQFSIASGGALKTDQLGNTRIQLLIAIVDPPSPIIKWRRRYGVCTRYVTALQAGQRINIGLQQGYLNVGSSESKDPVIMIGPGTGLAPMRSMIYQRLAWAQTGDGRKTPPLKDDILFFGCRSESADFYFRDEWDRLGATDGLSVYTAFSRDSHRPRQYVQDQIRAQGSLVRDALINRSGRLYVCGSSGNMPKGVRQAILDVLAMEDNGMSQQEAVAFLEEMEKKGRYKQETW